MKEFENLGVAETVVSSIKDHLGQKKETDKAEEAKKGVDLLSIVRNLSKRRQDRSKGL